MICEVEQLVIRYNLCKKMGVGFIGKSLIILTWFTERFDLGQTAQR